MPLCVLSVFRIGAIEDCFVLGYGTASNGNMFQKFRDNLFVA
jgi:hypothetical protein